MGPITFSNISEGKCTLSWNPPEKDGCSDITNYIVEKRETSKISWALVSDECKECTFNASKLIKTNEYQFRVSAANKFGVGRPLESSPIIAQMQYSKCKIGKTFSDQMFCKNVMCKILIHQINEHIALIYLNCFPQPLLILQGLLTPLRLQEKASLCPGLLQHLMEETLFSITSLRNEKRKLLNSTKLKPRNQLSNVLTRCSTLQKIWNTSSV